ncbi:hypothetical protein [Mycobacterium antarcticum]|uniref:hypothetical protein n=1 Tax=unclassified Mycolicibacterium TaxID=2636767 RepID=UPI0024E11B8A|nr:MULTISPECIES: hypothetical protein [unclassified Mycolicibacterium]
MTTREFLPIPPTDTATDPIGSPADLQQRWRALMGPLGFRESLLQFVFVGPDRRMLKVLSEIPLPARPDPDLIGDLVMVLRDILATSPLGTTVAFLLTRPGVGAITTADRRWSSVLTRAAADAGVPIEPVFRANDEHLVRVEPA